MVKTDQGEFPKYFEYKYYKNGKHTVVSWDGCFDRMTDYNNLNLSEVYHQMVNDYIILMNDNEIIIPKFERKTPKTIEFEVEEGTENLKIEVKANGNIEVSSYDCT